MDGQADDGLRCPRCEGLLSVDQRYCGRCGTAVRRDCAQCGRSCPPEDDYCGSCGQRLGATASLAAHRRTRTGYTPRHLADHILTTHSAVQGERKDVTVLFVDVDGSMELAQGTDPEEWHRILDRFFSILTSGIHRYEGTINQYTGDGIMALFGAPVAHENHAQRACYAALYLAEQLHHYAQDLRRRAGLDFAVRMGLSSGEVVVGSIGDDLRQDYTAQGYTVGLAARIMSVTEAGKIYLSSDTALRVAGFFDLNDLGEFHLKGVKEPARIYQLAGTGPLQTRFDAARVRGLSSFVGRESELAELARFLGDVVEGTGRVVGVSGGPGIGKSRLCYEFLGLCRARGLRIDEGRCLPHGQMMPLLPFRELLGSYLDVDPLDAPDVARARIAHALRGVEHMTEPIEAQVLELLGFGDPERPAPRMQLEIDQRRLFRALGNRIAASALEEPRAFLIEDLHWIDSASDAFLRTLVEVARRAPLLLLLNFRSEYRADWMGHESYRRVGLEPLASDAVHELLRDLVGEERASDPVASTICRRAGGNPFFLEELVRTWIDAPGSGALGLALPASVRGVVAARIDRLNARDKSVLHAAAVVGERFTAELVGRVVELPHVELGDALRSLVERGLVYPVDGDPSGAFCFEYPLVQEVAYGSQLAEHRLRAHRRVAETIEMHGDRSAPGRAAQLAHHWVCAGQPRRGAQWHAAAGRACEGLDPAGAASHWREVRRLLRQGDESRENAALEAESSRKLVALGWHVGLPRDEGRRIFEEGRALMEAMGDLDSLATLDHDYALQELSRGSAACAARWLDEAVRLSSAPGRRGLQLALRAWRAYALLLAGDLAEARKEVEIVVAQTEDAASLGAQELLSAPIEETLEYPEPVTGPPGLSPRVLAQFVLATVHARAGDVASADATFERLLTHAALAGDVIVRAQACYGRSAVAWVRGHTAEAERFAREGIDLCERAGACYHQAHGFVQLGRAQSQGGRHAAAIESLERAREHTRQGRLLVPDAEVLCALAGAHASLGHAAQALLLAEEAVASASMREMRILECDARLAVARALIALDGPGNRDRIESELARVEKLAGDCGALDSMLPVLDLVRGGLAASAGDAVRARYHRGRARVGFERMGAVPASRATAGRALVQGET